MIGLALVTFVTVLAQGIRSSWGSTVRKQVSADYILTTTSGWDSFSPAAAAAIAAHAWRRGGLERSERTGQGRRVAADRLGPRHGDGAPFLPLHMGRRLRRDAWPLGSNGAIVLEQFAKDHHLQVGESFRVEDDRRESRDARRARHPQAGRSRLAAREHRDLEPRLRHALHASAKHDGVRRNPRRRVALDARDGAQPLPRRDAQHRVGVREGPERVDRQDADAAVRAARTVRARQPVRHRQHARALDRRADARARRAPRGRHDPPPVAADDPPRERDHGADRRDDGFRARDRAGRARDSPSVRLLGLDRRRRHAPLAARSARSSSSRSRRSPQACSRRCCRHAARAG